MASLAVTVPKIAQCLAMMGSAHDGEALNAARAAERLRVQLGLQWADLLTNPPIEPPKRQETPSRDGVDPLHGRDWRAVAAACGRHRTFLNTWEATFIDGLHRFPRLSQKQRDALARQSPGYVRSDAWCNRVCGRVVRTNRG
jgi:hypothetical protein